MWVSRASVLLILFALARCEVNEDEDASSVFLEAAKSFLTNKENLNGLQGLARAFLQSDARKEPSSVFEGNANLEGVGQLVSGLGSLLSAGGNNPGIDVSMIGSLLSGMANPEKGSKRTSRSAETKQQQQQGIDLAGIVSMGSMLLGGGQAGNSDLLMGLVPMLLSSLGGESNDDADDGAPRNPHDHSGHSWYMPPVVESLHVMWDHFSNSELGQTLWKKSGVARLVARISDPDGRVQYEKLLDSIENPAQRRRWIRFITDYIGEWISHVSDPQIQQRYLNTIQFVGNSFLKSQGFAKSAMFDSMRPVESLSRLVNAMGKRHLGMKIDSSQYIKPAVAYVKELVALASEKGFIVSRLNAREISNRLSDLINLDIVNPILKSYRAYKWAIKRPQCASQILCTINEKNEQDKDQPRLRSGLAKAASFPVAWAVSNKLGIHFWVLYGAIMEHDKCVQKYPADCTDFHEEEIRVTTENVHSEL